MLWIACRLMILTQIKILVLWRHRQIIQQIYSKWGIKKHIFFFNHLRTALQTKTSNYNCLHSRAVHLLFVWLFSPLKKQMNISVNHGSHPLWLLECSFRRTLYELSIRDWIMYRVIIDYVLFHQQDDGRNISSSISPLFSRSTVIMWNYYLIMFCH